MMKSTRSSIGSLKRMLNRFLCNSWRAGGQQEGLQYNGEAAG